ncbi:tetratricopeptide repeat protein [Demequina sp. NBRC 110052]|uniref:tetratricopeptide repeat protein n=1 Tax=Demequina sp. NBRC 110052 TaxID=1570341 RepID=UPI000A035EBE|nr:tetratricopeptide repeat protein [Demequina sp. NBRC 110052]
MGRHLIMAGHLIDTDPELAYRHAQVASQRGGRVDVVREAAALTAYATGRYAEALREFRTVRRLNGLHDHLPLMADCERGLGRPERALALAQEDGAKSLDAVGRVELEIVVAGARQDLGEADAALVLLNRIKAPNEELRLRVLEARAQTLRALGREDEAAAIEAELPDPADVEEPEEDVILYDTAELPEEFDEHDGDESVEVADGDGDIVGDGATRGSEDDGE